MLTLPKISLGRSLRTYTHDLSFDNNTTMQIGVVQPLLTQYMQPGDKVSCNLKQLVRLAPMPVPSFARLSLVNKVKFVPMSAIYPAYDCLMSGQNVYPSSHDAYIPTSVPTITNKYLVYVLCNLLDTTFQTFSGSSLESLSISSAGTPLSMLKSNVFSDFWAFTGGSPSLDVRDTSVTFDNADFIFQYKSGSTFNVICVRLGRLGRILRSALVGLGYSLSPVDTEGISLLPILALYKAYYDTYQPNRDSSWTSTHAFRIIDSIYERAIVDCTKNNLVGGDGVFWLNELPQLFATYEDDFVSAHRLTANIAPMPSYTNLMQPSTNLATSPSIATPQGIMTSILQKSSDGHGSSLLSLQTLQRLQRYVNKDSIIGKKVSEWLKVHFGDNAVNDYFKESYNIRDIVTRCDINDIYSTADTSGTDGDFLGAFAGKGLGFTDTGFKFESKEFGYLFVLGAIMPKLAYFQGNDLTLYAKDRFTFPSADFDALGYELTPATFLRDDNGISFGNKYTANAGFGFIPRFSGFKVKKDIVNGDMSRRSTRSQMSAYHLERMISTPDVFATKVGSTYKVETVNTEFDLPKSSTQWRYVNRYSFMGNYNRIFYNSNGNAGLSTALDNVDDQFIVQTVFDFKLTNKLKPLSQSFDTYEETTDNSTVDVRAE